TVTGRLQTKPLHYEASLRRDVHVAGSTHGADRLGVFRIGLDLAAYASNANIDGAVERLPLPVACQREKLVTVENLVRPFEEDLEQLELHPGQRNFALVGSEQLVRSEI